MDRKRLLELAGVQLTEASGHLRTFYAIYDRSTKSFSHLLDGKHVTGNWVNGKPMPFPKRSGLFDTKGKAQEIMDKMIEIPKSDSTYENFDPVLVEIEMKMV